MSMAGRSMWITGCALATMQVDGGVPLATALARHTAWLREQGVLAGGKTCTSVSWTDWDM